MERIGRRSDIDIPVRPFLYTLDQVAGFFSITEDALKSYLWLKGRSVGAHPANRLLAVNIAPEDQTPVWRVAENELIRYMRRAGFRVYDRSWQR